MRQDFKIEGIDGALDKLRALKGINEVTLQKAVETAAVPVKKRISDEAPVRIGVLKREIRVEKGKEEGANVHIGPGWNAFYGGFHERGTRKMGKRPFMVPALKAEETTAITIVGEFVASEIKRRAK